MTTGQQKRAALVISGGGSAGAFAVGVVQGPKLLVPPRPAPLRACVTEALRPALFERLKREEIPHCYVVYTNFRTGPLEVASPKDSGMSL